MQTNKLKIEYSTTQNVAFIHLKITKANFYVTKNHIPRENQCRLQQCPKNLM